MWRKPATVSECRLNRLSGRNQENLAGKITRLELRLEEVVVKLKFRLGNTITKLSFVHI